MRGLEAYKGLPMFAGKQGDKVNHLENGKAKSKVSLMRCAASRVLLASETNETDLFRDNGINKA